MQIYNEFYKKFLFILVAQFLFVSSFYAASDKVASLGKIKGEVSVKVKKTNRTVSGRRSMILRDGDMVITGKNTNVSIVFRDGSEIRLFQNTQFLIEQSEETSSGDRSFRHKFFMKLGSFWGRFLKDRQQTEVRTPTATIGIKGTSLKLTETNQGSSVRLSSGLISVKNDDELIDLQPGKMINGITKKGGFKNKIKDIPYIVKVTSDLTKIRTPKGKSTTSIPLTIQIINQKTKKNLNRSGSVYLTADLDKVEFPAEVKLNKNGYARVEARVNPLDKEDYLQGQVAIFALMDGSGNEDVGAGKVTLTFDSNQKRKVEIDVNSGEMKKKM